MGLSRRRVLQGGAAAVAGAVLTRAAAGAGGRPAIRVTVTAADGRRLAAADPVPWGAATGPADTVTVDPADVRQPVLGFGAALTEASCFVLNRMPADGRDRLLAELFGPAGADLSVARLCIGSSDYSTHVYSYDEGTEADPELRRFSVDPDRAWVLPVVRAARAVRPDLFLFGSPWSPPAWMKYGGTMLGGTIRLKYLEPYAHYVLKYLQAYAAAGVAVDAVTVQNELGADQYERMPACIWSEEAEAAYVADHLGPLLRAAGVAAQVWIHDHNFDMAGRVMDQLAKAKLRPFVAGVAWHGYAGRPEQMGAVHRAHPDVPMHWTEGGPDLGDPHYQTNWAGWSRSFADSLRNGVRSVTTWNVALDEHGGPNVGPFHCGGLVTVDAATGRVTRSGTYWALAHHARAFRRGAHVVGSDGHVEGVSHVAAVNPDGSTAVVLTHAGPAARTVRLACGGDTATVTLPADAVVTLQWPA